MSSIEWSKTQIEKKNYNEAITVLTGLLKKDRKNYQIYFYLGIAKYNIEEYRESEKLLRKTIKLANDHFLAHYNLALCLEKQDKTPEAIEMYKQTLRINPNYENAKKKLLGLGISFSGVRKAPTTK